MNSPSLVAGSPAVERAATPERVPTDWKTGAMQKRIRRRYAAERRFRFFGLAAVVLSAGFLAFLLVTMLISGIGGFQRTMVTLPIDFPAAGLEVDRAQLKTRGADLALAGAGLENTVNGAAAAAFGEDNRVVSDSAWLTVRDAIKADPSILSRKVAIAVPAAPGIEEAAKADGEPSDEALVARLEKAGAISTGFNTDFFKSADSTDPTAVGIWGALKGSLMTMLVTLLIAFPVGTLSALYLEEYAPRNRDRKSVV